MRINGTNKHKRLTEVSLHCTIVCRLGDVSDKANNKETYEKTRILIRCL